MTKIELTIEQLEQMLYAQKLATAEYITRNLSTYSWFELLAIGHDSAEIKNELKREVMKSGFPSDFDVLKKYIKK